MAVGLTAALVAASVIFGAATQRMTGMGFALVAAPPLVLILGASDGVPLVQVLSLGVSFSVFISTFSGVAWRKAMMLLGPAILGIIPGWWLASVAQTGVLLILIGLMVVLAILAMLADQRARVFKGTPGLLSAGFLSGFMNVTAGVGGPAIVLYKLSTEWDHKQFVATVQVYFMALNTASLVAHGTPELPQPVWVAAVMGLMLGIALGFVLARRLPVKAASRLVVAVALAGSMATIVQGITLL